MSRWIAFAAVVLFAVVSSAAPEHAVTVARSLNGRAAVADAAIEVTGGPEVVIEWRGVI